MKTFAFCLVFGFCMMMLSNKLLAQKVTISGRLQVGLPGYFDTLLIFNTERPWIFRQYNSGPSTALELYSTVGLKNFFVSTTGNMGVDIPEPLEKLHVNGNIKAGGPKLFFGTSEYIGDAGSFLIECNGTVESTLDNTDNLGTSGRRWNSVFAVNGTINTSDKRAKTNIQNIPYGLKEIMMLRPVRFEWIERMEDGPKLGLLAQEVQPVIKEVVVDHEMVRDEQTGVLKKVPVQKLGMYYTDLIPVLIKGIQEQQQAIELKDVRITELENKMNDLQTRLAMLERLLITKQQVVGRD